MTKANFIALWLDRDFITVIVFLFPALCLLGVFLFYPIVYLLYLSFTTGSFTLEGATLVPSIVIPLGLAVLLNRTFALRGLLRAAYFIPSITSLVAVGLAFRWLFQTDGVINGFLISLGLESISWLSNTTWAMPVLILLSTWKQIGFNLVVFLAGLQTIPQSRYEAAELDGANTWAKFWYITLPGLKPTVVLHL